MVMTLKPNSFGGFRITQRLVRPVVYLDHWAVRLFAEDIPLQDRFIEALHHAGATWLFSTANMFEFTAMTDLTQAVDAERLLLRAIPAMHFADTTLDRGYLIEDGAPLHPDAPVENWLLKDLGARAQIAGGAWNTHRFVQDAINHRDELRPLFETMKKDIFIAFMASTQNDASRASARKFAPLAEMTLREALPRELMREPYINTAYEFDENDAMDLIHAIPAAVVCNFVLLDARWCHKVESAAKRMRKGGVNGEIARCFSRKTVHDFLVALESAKPVNPQLHGEAN